MKIACAAFALLLTAFPALAQNVKITPIGSHPGELCANDRAIIFEDPTGVRFLYDTGPTVTGGNDPRLGTIHVVLLTHMHGDHVGDLKLNGPAVGFVVKFTNGLVVYLSSDTAVFGDMKTVISDFHKASLAVINLGPNPGLFQSGAYAINDLLKPASVIFTHVNEAATQGGKLLPNTQTAALMKQVKAPAYLAISKRTMEL